MKHQFFAIALFALVAVSLVACGGAPPATVAPSGGAAAPSGATISIGALYDLTGATSDVGKDYSLGIQEAIACFNDDGGINGKKIKLSQSDYGYRVPEAVTIYKRFRDFDKVIALLGWGTGDTSALAPTVNKDQIPDISASYSGELSDASKTPYNFFAGTDYSTSARAAMQVWYDEVWKKDAKYASEQNRKPRVVMFYQASSPYSSAPIKALKDQAALVGFDVGPDQDVSLTALDTKSQVLAAKEFKADLIWHGNTTMSVSTALKDEKALGLNADNIVNVWGFDENLPRLAGDAAEGVIGIGVAAFYGEAVPGMDKVLACGAKYNPSVPKEQRLNRTLQAWANATLLKKALERADKAGQLTGAGVKAALETLQNEDIGMGVTPMTFTATDHRPGSTVRIYAFKGGKPQLIKAIDMKAKWPDKYASWLGY
jgi:branched-chain amino acid transport system substrate-binding protein